MTDAQWLAWLQDPKQERCTLAQLTFLGNNGGTPTEYHIYVADYIYAPPTATQRYDVCIQEVPTITESMSEQFTGKSEQTFSNLVVLKKDATVRKNWLNLNCEGRQYLQYLGHPSWPFSDFRIVLTGVLGVPVDLGGGKIAFPISDRSPLLDRSVMKTLLGGDGAEAAGLMPLAFGGEINNIRPKLVDKNNLLWQVSGVHTSGVTEYPQTVTIVREAGNPLSGDVYTISAVNAGTNVLTTSSPHLFSAGTRVQFIFGTPPSPFASNYSYWVIASGLTATDFKLSATQGGTEVDITNTTIDAWVVGSSWTYIPSTGRIKLLANPSGEITADVWGLIQGGTIVNDSVTPPGAVPRLAGNIIHDVLTSSQTNTPFTSADIDATSLAAFVALCAQACGVYVADQITFSDLLDQLVLSVGGWRGFDPATGKLIFGRLDLPAAGTPVYSFSSSDINDWSLKKEKSIPPKAVVKVNGVKNWNVQSGDSLAGAVIPYGRSFYSRDFYTATGVPTISDFTNDPSYHLLASYPPPYETFLISPSDTDNEATRIATLFQHRTDIWTFETGMVAFLLKRGDLIYVDDDAFTGYGIVVHADKNVGALSTIKFFAASTDYYPSGDLND